MVVTTRNTLSSSSNGSPLVLDYETKRFLAETIAGMVKGSLETMQRLANIEFLKFSGDDVKGWVFRCDQFFVMKQTPEMDNVQILQKSQENGQTGQTRTREWKECTRAGSLIAKRYPMIERIQGQRSNLRGACEEDLEASSPAINMRLLSLTSSI
ncbi:hypothetical protein Tco_1076881 [Tanacetum coccineum]